MGIVFNIVYCVVLTLKHMMSVFSVFVLMLHLSIQEGMDAKLIKSWKHIFCFTESFFYVYVCPSCQTETGVCRALMRCWQVRFYSYMGEKKMRYCLWHIVLNLQNSIFLSYMLVFTLHHEGMAVHVKLCYAIFFTLKGKEPTDVHLVTNIG